MPVQATYPGVYIQEVSSGSRTITGVSTSIALFIGMAPQGPLNEPTTVLSYTEFERVFGVTNTLGELHEQVKQFFTNGGSQAVIMRVANGAAAAALDLKNTEADDVITLTAVSPGVIGNNLRVHVDYDTPTPEITFNMRIDLTGVDSGGSPINVVSETFNNLSMNPNEGNYAIDVLNTQSALVSAELHDDAAAVIQAGYALWSVLEATAVDFTNFETKLGAIVGGLGKFRVSVDGLPYLTVSVNTATAEAVTSAINGAFSPYGKSVTTAMFDLDITPTYWGYRTVSAASGGRVRFAPVNGADDLAVPMGMTGETGALEVDGYSGRRPAPSGLFSRLRLSSDANFRTSFGNFTTVDVDTPPSVQFDDSSMPVEPINMTWATTDTIALNDGVGAIPSLLNVRNNIDALVTGLNANDDVKWTFARHGHRVVGYAHAGGDNGDTTGVINSTAVVNFDNYFSATTNVTRYQFATGVFTYQASAEVGSNGTRPLPADYDAAYAIIDREVDLFNLLVLPRTADQSDAHRNDLWGPASVFAMGRRALLLVDPPSLWDSIADVSGGIAGQRIGVATDHAAFYWPRITVSSGGALRDIDPSGAMAGVMARTDVRRGVWKAPAGLEANLLGVRGVEYMMSDGENGLINPKAVNAIRAFPNGIVSWGARTMVGFDNSGNDDYKFVPIRRLALYIEESLYRGLKWAVFEPNDEPLWRQLRQSGGAFMNNLFRLGAFKGAKATEAYFVKCDKETTTQNDINLGIVNVVIGFAPLKPAEFVVITLQQQAGEVQT
jgi:phage tail sheath protein FI